MHDTPHNDAPVGPCVGTPTILAHHAAELARSGIDADFAIQAGVYSETFPDKIRYALNWKRKARAPGIVYRYRDFSTGEVNGYCRVKLDTPRVDAAGKAIKYEAPRETPNHAYCPPGTFAVLRDTAVSLILTEGEKKALAADAAGLACIAIPGVFAWKKKKQEWSLPEFDLVEWRGRTVYIAFDSDATTNDKVHDALLRLARHLKSRGAIVRVVAIPNGPSDAEGQPARVGIDGYIVEHGAGAFHALLAAAQEPEEDASDVDKIDASRLDPVPTARRFLGDDASVAEGKARVCRLRFWRGEWWLHTGCRYAVQSSDVVKAQLVRHLDGYAKNVTSTATNNIIAGMKAISIIGDAIEQPAWLEEGTLPADELIATPAGLVHLPTFAEGGAGYLLPNSPRFFSANALDYAFDAQAKKPELWFRFLRELWGDDTESISTLQEWYGYLLTNDTRQQKILGIIGPRRSGKGTLMRVLRALVGAASVVNPTLAGLGTQFGLWPLLGKSVAVISDARMSGRTDAAVVTERLLSISGEDAQTIDRKCLAPVTVKLPTRFVVLTNELPRLGDSSGALAGRFILLRLTRSFFGHEDPTLTEKLLTELPGILLWAVAGWQRLRERGRFVQPEAGRELTAEMEDLSSPVGQFIRERCIVDPQAEVARTALYAAWREWCQQAGRRETDEATFGRDLRAAVPQLGSAQPNRLGVRVRIYTGIGLPGGTDAAYAPSSWHRDTMGDGRDIGDNLGDIGSGDIASPVRPEQVEHVPMECTCDEKKNNNENEKKIESRDSNRPEHVPPVPPPTEAANPRVSTSMVQHANPACNCPEYWESIYGEFICRRCKPCKDHRILEGEGVAE